jgi:uncharacterized protein (AIM24 family)
MASIMARYTIGDFVSQTVQKDRGEGLFELENDRTLEVNLNGMVWAKLGSMVAYRGAVRFEREGMLDHGLGTLLKKAVSGEGAHLMRAVGNGKLYLADEGKRISILNLQSQSIYVNGNDLLAFEPSLKYEIKLMRRVSTMMAGGLFNIRLEGTGMAAITTYYDPVTLMVTPDSPVSTDPNATVAWSGSLYPELKTDITFKTLLGRGSGETFQMEFRGSGFVVVQPYEEVYFQVAQGQPH